MKIYILPVKKEFQPPTISVIYPPHNKDFMDGEETFLDYLKDREDILTINPDEADWYYLPIFWTHWLVNHNFGNTGLDLLQAEVNRVLIDDSKTFTIYEYAEQPKVELGETISFLGSRTSPDGLDIPLLCRPHSTPQFSSKKYLASFVGNISTHPIRQKLKDKLQYKPRVLIAGSGGSNYFTQIMVESYIALCPRGYGGASYRFYEAMQLGTIPFLIGDIDHRPFKKFLDWNRVSLYTNNITGVEVLLNSLNESTLLAKGMRAKRFYEEELANGNWCKYILKELDLIK
jgi:hypothetical protein